MRPDELFVKRRLRTRLSLVQPDLQPTIDRAQTQQDKCSNAHAKDRPPFIAGEAVMVRNERGTTKWLPGVIQRQKGLYTYLVQVGGRVRFCHADHLIKRRLPAQQADDQAQIQQDLRQAASIPSVRPAGPQQPISTTSQLPETSRRARQITRPRRWLEEM